MNILHYCELLDERGNLPSWTPNWSISTRIFEFKESDAFAPVNAHYLGKGVLRAEGIVGGVLAAKKMYQESTYLKDNCLEI